MIDDECAVWHGHTASRKVNFGLFQNDGVVNQAGKQAESEYGANGDIVIEAKRKSKCRTHWTRFSECG